MLDALKESWQVVPVPITIVQHMFCSQVLTKWQDIRKFQHSQLPLGPGEVSSDGAGSSRLNHTGLAHGVLHLVLVQGVAQPSYSLSTLNSLSQVHRSLKVLCHPYTTYNPTTTNFPGGIRVDCHLSIPCLYRPLARQGYLGKNTPQPNQQQGAMAKNNPMTNILNSNLKKQELIHNFLTIALLVAFLF